MTIDQRERAMTESKVPAVTLGFWVIKILATTLGETGGDSVSMSWLGETTPEAGASALNGYLIGTAIFLTIFLILAAWQMKSRRFHPLLYWATIIASTTAGTTMADFATRSMGIGYAGGSALLLALVIASLAAWKLTTGTIRVESVSEPRSEAFYWLTITFSQTLGTALGDWVADTNGVGFGGGAIFFGALLALIAGLYSWTGINRVFLFWAAFILTRPLGATVGDLLDKPTASGGLSFSRPLASAVLAMVILALILLLPQRPGRHPAARDASI
ncbi:MAG: hypothetical protein H0W74_06630 [Sphingosinicella sp.]|nr:hypothetical protein [Sphingosinicella sp.]